MPSFFRHILLPVFALLVGLPPLAAAPTAEALQSGHAVARTRRTVNGTTETTSTELWFSGTRSRLAVRQGTAKPVIEVFDGTAMYRWTEGAKSGQVWHPRGLRVVEDVVTPLLSGVSLPSPRRVGKGRVAGHACTIFQATRKAAADGSSWWKGDLDTRVWETSDPRFRYALRYIATDKEGTRLESEVTTFGVNITVEDSRFRIPEDVEFYPPAQVRRGRRVAGGPEPVSTHLRVHLGDALGKEEQTAERITVTMGEARFALDTTPLATEEDVEEVRLEPYASGASLRVAGAALVLYLKSGGATRVAQAAGAARGRNLVVLLEGEPVTVTRLTAPWIEENNRVFLLGHDWKHLLELGRRLGGVPPDEEKK